MNQTDCYKLVNIDKDPDFMDQMPFVIKYYDYVYMLAPVLAAVVYMLIIIFIIFGSPNALPLLMKIVVVSVFSPVVAYFFWHTIKNGKFVLAANDEGIVYQMLDDKRYFLFIHWKWIGDIKIYDDGSRVLQIHSSIDRSVVMPRPCNGLIQKEPDTYVFLFTLGIKSESDAILDKLVSLKGREVGV